MDTGGLAHMNYTSNTNTTSAGFGVAGNGFATRNRSANNTRLSVALPPRINPITEDQVDNPAPRTSRSHLLAGLRTAPKSQVVPSSAPYSQMQHNLNGLSSQWQETSYNQYYNSRPHSAIGSTFGNQQYAMNAGQQTYSLPEQVLAPPVLYGQEDEMDPNVLEQLQLTGLFLAQRQQQLQQQLANITAAANQLQGMNGNIGFAQQSYGMMNTANTAFYGQQQPQSPMEVPGQPGMYIVQNPMTGQYQYMVDNSSSQVRQQAQNHLPQSRSMQSLGLQSTSPQAEIAAPYFRAEISAPSIASSGSGSRSETPRNASSPQPPKESVVPLPPPSANAFRRGHKKATSLAFTSLTANASEGPKTASNATFGTARSVFPPTPLTGTFGPGAARVGEHPIRQPIGPPPLEELKALPTAKHEGSKNFAARQGRPVSANLPRSGSFRRVFSNSPRASPVSECELSFQISEGHETSFSRKQSPIGIERSVKRGSQESLESVATGSSLQTPATEEMNMFDMRSFIKQLPVNVQQGHDRKRMMLGVLTAAEKRKSSMF